MSNTVFTTFPPIVRNLDVQWNETTNATDAPTSTPTVVPPTPGYSTYYAPSASQVIMYIVITSLIIIVLTILNRRNPRTTTNNATGDAAATSTNGDNTAAQDQVDLVKSMSPEERKEYVTNFLRTQKFVDDNNDSSYDSSVSFRVTKSTSFRVDDNLNDDEYIMDIESKVPAHDNNKKNIPASSDKVYPGCAICLERFKNGEDICCAQNQDCPHEFHLECLFPWLLKSQDCPCCRRDYLSIATMPTEESMSVPETQTTR